MLLHLVYESTRRKKKNLLPRRKKRKPLLPRRRRRKSLRRRMKKRRIEECSFRVDKKPRALPVAFLFGRGGLWGYEARSTSGVGSGGGSVPLVAWFRLWR
jgi:hypothetical protein